MQKYLTARGTLLVVGLTKRYPRPESISSQRRIPYVDFNEAEQYPVIGHSTVQGNVSVFETVDRQTLYFNLGALVFLGIAAWQLSRRFGGSTAGKTSNTIQESLPSSVLPGTQSAASSA